MTDKAKKVERQDSGTASKRSTIVAGTTGNSLKEP
jgi:hypothetical protein